MKSVDALRELVKRDGLILEGEEFDKCLDAIEEESRTRYGAGHNDGAALAFELTKLAYKGDDERYQFCRRVELAANDRNDVTLFGVDYTPLPVDVDGKFIHIGDDVGVIGYDNGTVASVDIRDNGKAFIGVRPYGWDTPTVYSSEWITHRDAPTVEDVLREFLGEMQANESDPHRTIAEFAAKLRLAGDAS
jgi:hypothetical protein